MSRCKSATDERDKVYALLALARDDIVQNIKPDYSAENTVATVFLTIAEEYVRQGFGIDLLQYSGSDHRTEVLPSWVPDWSHQTKSTFQTFKYSHANFAQPHITLGPKPGHLQVRGAIIDSLDYLGIPFRFYSLDFSEDRLHREFIDDHNVFPPVLSDMHMRQVIYATSKMMFHHLCSTDLYPEGLDIAMARTLTADCTRAGERSETDPEFINSFAAFKAFNDASLQMPELSKQVEPDSEEARLLNQAWPYESAVQEVHKGRRICVTKGRYMGITTYDTQKSDLLVLIEGSKMPFVLRSKSDDFEIIGDCYIHGIMDGELKSIPEESSSLGASQIGIDQKGEEYCVRLLTGGFATFQTFTIV